jgi:hypothetical protein
MGDRFSGKMEPQESCMTIYLPAIQVRALYDNFNAPVTELDCGKQCAVHSASGKPFCCDICEAVPAAYHQEWDYLRLHTDLWHEWRGDECSRGQAQPGAIDPVDLDGLRAETPAHMRLLACKGPADCQRVFRALSCRQFPFFPYVTADYRFLGLAYEWEFEPLCWVISHLEAVTPDYRREFVSTYDGLFALWQEEFESYAIRSEQMRAAFSARRRRIPVLHRNGGNYLLSPLSERIQRVTPGQFKRFGPYRSTQS